MASRKIEDLTTEMQALYIQFQERMQNTGIDFIVTCTYRSQAEQDALYAQGRTTQGVVVTWAKHSRHTDREAFDIAIIKDGKVSWKTTDYEEAGRIGMEVGLEWGGTWKTKDAPHFELKR
jgi:peptidoglycan L-alanyl-D-glutamate endopeptidase CwlK